MQADKCSDTYYKAINIDSKCLLILKSEDVELLEESKQVLLDHYKKKGSHKIHYDVDYLLGFKDLNFDIETATRNLARLLGIRRDDYLKFSERKSNTPTDSSSDSIVLIEDQGVSDSTHLPDLTSIDADTDQMNSTHKSRSFSFNLDAKKFFPSGPIIGLINRREESHSELDETVESGEIERDQFQSVEIKSVEDEEIEIKSGEDENFGLEIGETVESGEIERDQFQSAEIKSVEDEEIEIKSDAIESDDQLKSGESRPGEIESDVQNKSEEVKSDQIGSDDQMKSGEVKSKVQGLRSIFENAMRKLEDEAIQRMSRGDPTNRSLSKSNLLDARSEFGKSTFEDENANICGDENRESSECKVKQEEPKTFRDGINQIGRNFDIRNMN